MALSGAPSTTRHRNKQGRGVAPQKSIQLTKKRLSTFLKRRSRIQSSTKSTNPQCRMSNSLWALKSSYRKVSRKVQKVFQKSATLGFPSKSKSCKTQPWREFKQLLNLAWMSASMMNQRKNIRKRSPCQILMKSSKWHQLSPQWGGHRKSLSFQQTSELGAVQLIHSLRKGLSISVSSKWSSTRFQQWTWIPYMAKIWKILTSCWRFLALSRSWSQDRGTNQWLTGCLSSFGISRCLTPDLSIRKSWSNLTSFEARLSSSSSATLSVEVCNRSSKYSWKQ